MWEVYGKREKRQRIISEVQLHVSVSQAFRKILLLLIFVFFLVEKGKSYLNSVYVRHYYYPNVLL